MFQAEEVKEAHPGMVVKGYQYVNIASFPCLSPCV